jgi:hypothetical protein
MRSAAATPIEIARPATDAELPESLRGKNLVLGKPLAIWPLGLSTARDGRRFLVDDRSVQSLLANGNSQEFVSLTYSHESDPNHGDDNAGYGRDFFADDQFIRARQPLWTEVAAAKLKNGSRGPVSPDAYCEPLHPETLETLTPDSPLYDPATETYKTNTFRPMTWRAVSLVGVPALPNLPVARLSADLTHHLAPVAARKETSKMKFKRLPGLSKNATEAQKSEALSAFRGLLKLPETATEGQVLAAAGAFDKAGILAVVRAAYKLPDAVTDEILSSMLDGAFEDEPAAPAPEMMAKATPPTVPPPAAMPAPTATLAPEAMATAAASAVRAMIPRITSDATAQVRTELAAQRRAEDIDAELLAAERAGRLVAAEREEFRLRLASEQLAAGARRELAARATGYTVPVGDVVSGGGIDPSISVDRMPRKEAAVHLTRAAAWAAQTGKEFHLALADVRGKNSEAEAFHRQVLASNPDYLRIIHGEEQTGARGVPWNVNVRAVNKPVDVDRDLHEHVLSLVKLGAISEDVLPGRLQQSMLARQRLSDASNFQPGSVSTIPNFAVAVAQGEYVADLVCPPVTGGVNEECSYPIFSTEARTAVVGEDGYPRPVGYETEAIEETRWGVIWQKITQQGYSNRVRADRRSQRSGDAVLPIGVLAYATQQALAIEKNKREIYVSKLLRVAGNYNALCKFDLAAPSGRSYENPASTPLQDFKKIDNQLWRNTGQVTEARLIPRDVLTALQYHPDFVRFAQIATQGQGQPMAYAPEAFIAIALGPIITPTALISTSRGGASADTPWGQDVINFVANPGKVMAPRAFANVVSAGYPIVNTFPHPEDGLIGVDFVKVSDMYAPQIVGVSNDGKTITTPTLSAFLLQNASPALGHATL